MTAREDERKKSLDALRRIADESQAMPWLKKEKTKPPARVPPRMPPAPAEKEHSQAPTPRASPPARPRIDPRFEGKRAKLEEEKRLRDRRTSQLAGGKDLQWRGMSWGDVPTGIRRTPFDRKEPNVTQKINDVLGDAKEKEGRAKAKAKGKRQSGAR